jgi:hypothetical protein
MSGYCGFSKSNRAIEAEIAGKMTATALARQLKVSAKAVARVLNPCEWHHTSCRFNATNYYRAAALLALVNGYWRDEDRDDMREALHALRAMRTYDRHRATNKARSWAGCRVMWLEREITPTLPSGKP